MGANCEIFKSVNLTFQGHYTHACSTQSYWNKYRKQNVCQTKNCQVFIDDEEQIWLLTS